MEQNIYKNYYWQDDKIRLRAMLPEDWESHYKSRFDSEARRKLEYYVELPPTESEDRQMAEYFSNFNQSGGRIMFVIETLDGQAVGGINLNSIDERNGTFSVGGQIYPRERGKGYGYSALRMVVEYAFMERRLHKWNSACISTNEASVAVHRKMGCTQEGVRRQVIYTNGTYYDEFLFGLTVDEFNEMREVK